MKNKNNLDNIHSYETLLCPCCKIERNSVQFSTLINFKIRRFDTFFNFFDAAERNVLSWACDVCLKHGKALDADPNEQSGWGMSYPYLAYYDLKKTCSTCSLDFIFTKEEQKHWYEDLKFIVYSEAKDCEKCRKDNRRKKQISNKLTRLIKNFNSKNSVEIKEIISIYIEMKNSRKARYYLSFLRKLKINIEQIKQDISKIENNEITGV